MQKNWESPTKPRGIIIGQAKLNAYQTHTGTVIVREDVQPSEKNTAIYCRVSSSENKTNFESQKQRLLV